ncbi:putative ribonuclease H-like domain-containing protein [Tanacetum coccineum]
MREVLWLETRQGYTQEKGLDYDEMDVMSAFLYRKIEEEVYVCQPPVFEDPKFPDRVYKVEKALYGLHQAPRVWSIFILVSCIWRDIIYGTLRRSIATEFEKLMHKKFQMSSMGELTFFLGLQVTHNDDGIFISQDKPDIMFADSPFDLEAYTDSDYAGASLDRKSTTGGCQFLRSRLISWQCKKQTVVANSTTEAEYVLWIQNQLLDYGYNFMNTKIFIDNESTICIVKNPVFHSKTKHIEIRHHFIRDSNEKKLIQMIKIHTDQNVADLLTKAFDIRLSIRGGGIMERAATTAACLDAKHDNGNINRTQSIAIPNVPFPHGIGSCDSTADPVTTTSETITTVSVNPKDSTAVDVSLADNVTLAEPCMAIRKSVASRPKTNKDSIEVRIDVDAQLAERIQAEEREHMSVEEQARLLMEFILARKKFFVAKRAEEQRNKPPTKAEQRKKIGKRAENSKKRTRAVLGEESVKRQKVEDDAEKAELKSCLEIVPNNDSAVNIIRADGSTKYYKLFSAMLDDFDRQDVLDLYRLVKERFETTSPEGYDRLLWGDLITLFEPSKEDEIWKTQQDYTLISWKLYDSRGVHLLLMDTGCSIHMLVEKKYHLT